MENRTSASLELDIGGHNIHPGSKVNVKWRGVWYDGTVVQIGPKRNLCRVRDYVTGSTLVIDPKQLKFMETQMLNKNFVKGTPVAYNDGDNWMEGVVEKLVIGAALVSWRRRVHDAEMESWFEVSDIAPVIPNEAYLSHNNDLLTASKSGLFHNDMIEPRPRTVKNAMYYESDGDSEGTDLVMYQQHHLNNEENKHFVLQTSPTYESIKSPDNPPRSVPHSPQHRPLPELPHSPYVPSPSHTSANHPPIVFPRIVPYGYNWNRSAHPLYPHRFAAQQVHPVVGKSLQQSSVPCAWTYRTSLNRGIPPHHSSSFFRRFKGLLSHSQRDLSAPQSPRMVASPSILSNTHSEPVPSGFQPRGYIQPRKVSSQTTKRILWKRTKGVKTKQYSKKSPSRSPVPLPYEVPVRDTSTSPEKEDLADQIVPIDEPNVDVPGKHSQTKQIKQEPPKIASASPSKLKVCTGGTVLLTCVANSTTPIHYEWFNNGQLIKANAQTINFPSPGMLEIQKTSLGDAGEYSCVISNDFGSITRSFSLYVIEDAFSAFNSTPEKQSQKSPALQAKFTSKVTYNEISTLPHDTQVNASVQDYLNEIVDEIHISDDDVDVANSTRTPADGVESSGIDTEADMAAEKDDTLQDLPTIVVTPEHVPGKSQRRRYSSVLKNDMEQYLEGYGEDYGALSSSTDLELEGLRPYKPKEIAKSLASKDKSDVSPTKSKARRFLKFPKLSKSRKEPGESSNNDSKHKGNIASEQVSKVPKEVTVDDDENSIAVNTSLGSAESLLGDEDKGNHVSLPLEIESISDQVRRLQISLEEYEDSLPKVIKKKGVITSLFSSKNKTITLI